MNNWQQDFVSFNSFCNHTRDKEIDFVIIRMITDRLGRHEIEVLLPSLNKS